MRPTPPRISPAVAGVVLGIVGGLFLHRVVLVLKTLPLLPEKIRAWMLLRSLTRRGGPVHICFYATMTNKVVILRTASAVNIRNVRPHVPQGGSGP
jgi:hypothetical protein